MLPTVCHRRSATPYWWGGRAIKETIQQYLHPENSTEASFSYHSISLLSSNLNVKDAKDDTEQTATTIQFKRHTFSS